MGLHRVRVAYPFEQRVCKRQLAMSRVASEDLKHRFSIRMVGDVPQEQDASIAHVADGELSTCAKTRGIRSHSTNCATS